MAIDFNATYTINTDKGAYLIPIFHSTAGSILYHGVNIGTDYQNVNLQTSVLGYSEYRYSWAPAMGNIKILNNGVDTGNYFISSQRSYGYYYNGRTSTGGWDGEPVQNWASITMLGLIVNDNDQWSFCTNVVRNNKNNIAVTPNTANEFGYWEGAPSQYMTLANIIWQENFTTTMLPLLTLYRETTDPYAPGGTSETGGGTGSFDLTSDAIDFPSLPTLTAVSTGLVSIYTPTLTQLNSLASFLWNANVTDVDWWKKLVANPLDLILGLSIVPVSVPAGASQNIKVGLIDTGVAMTKAATQFVTVDCGSINVAEVWGSALDYSPFTKFSIYLPFIGTRTINTDDIMGKTVQVKYNVDLLSGACTAMVKCGSSVLYQYSGACAISVPLTGQTFTDMITSTIQLAASIGATIASGGAAAGITAASAANSVMSMKPQIERAGGVSGAAGQLGIMTPYLIAEVPRQSVPARYNTFAGYPSNINAVLGDLTGYTEIETIYIKGISATKTELDEIETLLKAGVII